MEKDRIFPVENFIHPSEGAPVRSVVTETPDAAVIVWHVGPGQEIAPHIHPEGQDTWIVRSGRAEYRPGGGKTEEIGKGDVVVAERGEVHGAVNSGSEPFIFVSVVSPAKAGFENAEG